MPLDNAKLARAVSTTEKLVQRMDALEARRRDVDEKKEEGLFGISPKKWAKMSIPSGHVRLEPPTKRSQAIKPLDRKDDYGHPVKSNNRVQQTDYGLEAENKFNLDAKRGQEDS